MKVHRSSSVARKPRVQGPRNVSAPVAQGGDLFDSLDLFLTGLILDRAPVDARTGLGDWLAQADRKASKARARKKGSFASAS